MNTLTTPQIQLLVPAAAPNAPVAPDPLFDLYAWDPAHPDAQHGMVLVAQAIADYEPGAATLLWLRYAAIADGTVLAVEGSWPKDAPLALVWRDDGAPQFSNQAQICWHPASGTLGITQPRSATGPDAWNQALAQARAFLAPTGGLLIQHDFARGRPAGEWLPPDSPTARTEGIA
jgi:hypothetical protein